MTTAYNYELIEFHGTTGEEINRGYYVTIEGARLNQELFAGSRIRNLMTGKFVE